MTKNSPTPIEPLGARVLVQPIEQENRTTSGLIIPETAKEKQMMGHVLAIGDDELIKVKEDDTVLYSKYTGTEFRHNGAEYLLLECSDILACVHEN